MVSSKFLLVICGEHDGIGHPLEYEWTKLPKMLAFATVDRWPEILQELRPNQVYAVCARCWHVEIRWDNLLLSLSLSLSIKGTKMLQSTVHGIAAQMEGIFSNILIMQNLALWNAHWRLHWRHIAGHTQEHSEEFDGKLSVNFFIKVFLLVCVLSPRASGFAAEQCEDNVCTVDPASVDSQIQFPMWSHSHYAWGESWLWQTWFHLLRTKPNRQAFAQATSDPQGW